MSSDIAVKGIPKSVYCPRKGFPVIEIESGEPGWLYSSVTIGEKVYKGKVVLTGGKSSRLYVDDMGLSGTVSASVKLRGYDYQWESDIQLDIEPHQTDIKPIEIKMDVEFRKKIPMHLWSSRKETLARLSVESFVTKDVKLTLYKGDEIVLSDTIHLSEGKTVTKDIRATTRGLSSGQYTVELSSDGQIWKRSGSLTFCPPAGTEGLEFKIAFSDSPVCPHPSAKLFDITCENKRPSKVPLFITVNIDGKEVSKNVSWIVEKEGGSFDYRTQSIKTDVDETHLVEIIVCDQDGRTVFVDESDVLVMSKNSFDLRYKKDFSIGFMEGRSVYRELFNNIIRDPFSLKGYQEEGKHIVPTLKLIYDSLQEKGFTYCVTPTPRGNYQFVRPSCETLDERRGSCLDLTVMMVDFFENSGFGSVIVYLDGHCVAGVELPPEVKEKNLNGAATIRLDGRRIIPIESTMICSGGCLMDAIKAGFEAIKRSKTRRALFIGDFGRKPFKF